MKNGDVIVKAKQKKMNKVMGGNKLKHSHQCLFAINQVEEMRIKQVKQANMTIEATPNYFNMSRTFPPKLDGKVAIITGGASGIGEATAHHFAAHGVRGIVIADIQDDIGQAVAASIGLHRCTYIHCDVTNEDQVKSMVELTVRIYGQIDIMFTNAGVVSPSRQNILDLDFSQYDHLISINARGMAACVKYAAREMVRIHIKGSIICTASVAGSTSMKVCTDYVMSKHAVIGLMRAASQQLGEHGIRVNSVSPAMVATPMTINSLKKRAEQIERDSEPMTALKGIVLKVSHVAEAVLFLASDESSFITGHDLLVDGGFAAKG